MKHSFTDQQLTDAYKAALKECGCGDTAADYMNAFLNALPEPATDEWEACDFEDIQKGDRVRLVQAGRTTDFHLPVIETHPTHLVLRDNTQCSNFHKALYYRIPAPVQHPDPEQHPVILVTKVFDTEHEEPTPMIWDGGTYYESPKGCFHVESITDWSPAKVVEDDR